MKRRKAENGILLFHAFSLITPVQILPHCCRINRRGKVRLDLLLRPDPHADPHGKTSGRKQWNKQAATSSFLEPKVPESLAVQRTEDSEAVGKDEVGSSNLPSSSNNFPRNRKISGDFCYIFELFEQIWIVQYVSRFI